MDCLGRELCGQNAERESDNHWLNGGVDRCRSSGDDFTESDREGMCHPIIQSAKRGSFIKIRNRHLKPFRAQSLSQRADTRGMTERVVEQDDGRCHAQRLRS